jgi:hypothetical protein
VWRGYAENHCIHLEIRELNLNYGIYERNNKKENVPQSEPVHPSSQDTTLIMSKMFESMLKPIEAAHAQQVAALNQQITDKQSIIDLQADKIKSQAAEIARLQKFIADLRSMPTSINIEDVLKKYPFVIGVADHTDTTRAQV